MAEAVGLFLGIAGLAGLYSTCLDGFDQFQAAKSYGKDYEILLTRLDITKTRLLQWGDGVGLLSEDDADRDSRLDREDTQPTIERILHCINMLLTNSGELRSKYGLEDMDRGEVHAQLLTSASIVSGRRMESFQASFAAFEARIHKQQQRASIMSKVRWAIRGRTEFTNLINTLDGMIENLYRVVSISPRFRRLMVQEDIDALPGDTTTLRLIEDACANRQDEWSEITSLRVEASAIEMGSQQRRRIEDWIPDATSALVSRSVGHNAPTIHLARSLNYLTEDDLSLDHDHDAGKLPISSAIERKASQIGSLDLIHHYHLDACWHEEYTLIFSPIAGPRKAAKRERWTRLRLVGRGSGGVSWLEKLMDEDKSTFRVMKEISKSSIFDSSRNLYDGYTYKGTIHSHRSHDSENWLIPHNNSTAPPILWRFMDESESREITYQILGGLNIMHDYGITHRDLKPQNLYVVQTSPNWWVKIGGFDISKRSGSTTTLHTVCGTFLYSAPEILGFTSFSSFSYTNAIDLWALGCVLHLLLTGTTPFPAARQMLQYANGITNFPLQPLTEHSVTPEATKFIECLLAVVPGERPSARTALKSTWMIKA